MLNERDVGKALERVNPIPDPERAVSGVEADILFEAIVRRRKAMVLTDQDAQTADRPIPKPHPTRRRRLVLVTAALLLLIAAPATAFLLDVDIPLLEREFAPGSSEPAVFGSEAGLGENCALAVDFDTSGAAYIAGECGLLRFDGDDITVVNRDVGYGSVKDVAVGDDGTVWIAGIDQQLVGVRNGVATTYPLVATAVEITNDGTIWAIWYDHPPGLSSLVSFDGSRFIEHDVGAVVDEELVAAAEGSLLTLVLDPVGYDPDTQAAIEWHQLLGRVHRSGYETEPYPEGFAGDHITVAPDGSLYAIGDSLVRYDGSKVTTTDIPFPEANDVTVLADGTVWVSSHLYGVFAFDGTDWVRYGTAEGLPDEEVTFVAMAPDGSIYIGTRLGLTRIPAETG